jgi:Rha family phage regulatory protein
MSNTVLKIDPRQLVSIQDNQITTTSLIIADAFGKLHKNVIRAIENLDIPDEFTTLNFELCYENNDLQNGKPQKYYKITKDGFALLAMGFTGVKAMQFKVAYINAFNAMAEQLAMSEREQIALLESKLAKLDRPATLTPDQQRHIQETVIDIAKNQGVHYQTTYHNIKTQFKVGTYKDILKTQYPDLCQFLGVMPVYDVENIPHDIPVLATMTSEQKEVIHSNLIQVMSLFNPLSEPFSKLQAVGRALKGKHPNTGSNHNGYLAVL